MRRKVFVAFKVCLLVIAVVLVTSERGGMARFSPHTLEYQIQIERTIFAIGVPFYRSGYKPVGNALVDLLVEEGFVTAHTGDPVRWEQIFHWNDSWRGGEGPLYGIFHQNRTAVVDWSRGHRESAQLYWTEVFKLLRSTNDRDVLIGLEVVRRCRGIEDVEEMRSSIDEVASAARRTLEEEGDIRF